MMRTPLELGRLSRQRSRAARQDMGRMRGARFDRYCIIEVMCLCSLLQIYIHVQGQDIFLHGPLLHTLDGMGTGQGLLVCLILYLGWEHGFGGNGAAYKHSLYLVLYKYIYKMRVNPLG